MEKLFFSPLKYCYINWLDLLLIAYCYATGRRLWRNLKSLTTPPYELFKQFDLRED